MAAQGKHRRPKSASRRLHKGFVAVNTGGAALVLPAVGAGAAHAAPAEKPAAAERTGASNSGDGSSASQTYSVAPGDSLHKIAERFSVDGGWKKLYEENRDAVGADPSMILPGTKLTVGANSGGANSGGESRSSGPAPSPQGSANAQQSAYSDNLDGWIRESLDIMKQHGIPGSYEGIHRNIMRESGGDPRATNGYDSNAAAGTPSQGLLQVIAPTFAANHVPGTSQDPFDPVANITAACNYAAKQYGSIDNVSGAY
ncbi:LysM peptidoglycan-binding domain-containing protein [Streptomyces sp. ODS28]|uniref:LysM peptidoglycan-binding domain-containing protein n=1 Tax=Streptomyces sp. ODS28 TaxID=3136688 RepID=UPI0031E8114D